MHAVDFALAPARSAWKNRELLWEFTKRSIEATSRGSILGVTWTVLNPLLLLGLYYFVFGTVFKGTFGVIANESRLDYAFGVFLSLTIFHTVSDTLGGAPYLVVNNANFVKKVIFPLEIIPTAAVGNALYGVSVSIGLLAIGMLTTGQHLSLSFLWLPVIIFPLMLISLGVTLVLSGLGVFFRDLGQFMPFFTLALMYSSGVFYSSHKIPEEAWALLRFNPLFQANELARNVVLWKMQMEPTSLAFLYATGLVSWTAGYWVFKRLQPAFADVL